MPLGVQIDEKSTPNNLRQSRISGAAEPSYLAGFLYARGYDRGVVDGEVSAKAKELLRLFRLV